MSAITTRLTSSAFSLERSLTLQQLGRFDPTATMTPTLFTKRYVTQTGTTVVFTLTHDEQGMVARFDGDVGEDEQRYADRLAQLDALDDGLSSFVPHHPVLKRLALAFSGLRLLAVPWLFDVAAGAVLQQRVSYAEACSGFKRIALRHGVRGPDDGVCFPGAQRLAALPTFELEALGIDVKRARALHALAKEEVFRSLLHIDVDRSLLRQRLARIHGIGPWTTEMILGFGMGDPDAVPVGDLHLPELVCRVLADEKNGTDARMLEVLEPYRGHRFRVVRLLWLGVFHAPRLLERR